MARKTLKAKREPLEAPMGFRVFPSEREAVEELADCYGIHLSAMARIVFRRGLETLQSTNELAAR